MNTDTLQKRGKEGYVSWWMKIFASHLLTPKNVLKFSSQFY